MSDETQLEEPPDGGAPEARRREAGGWKAARWVRRAVQIAFLIFFVYLLFAALQRRTAFPLADLFFRFDPRAASMVLNAASGSKRKNRSASGKAVRRCSAANKR